MPKRKFILTLAIICGILIGIFFAIPYFNNGTTTKDPWNFDPKEVSCNLLKTKIEKALYKSNYCNENSDCTYAAVGCPFDCCNFINENINKNKIEDAYLEYYNRCKGCIYDCDRCAYPEEIECFNNKCWNTRNLP